MASHSSRSVCRLARQTARQCSAPTRSIAPTAAASRALSSTSKAQDDSAVVPAEAGQKDMRPRWSYTPHAMKSRFPTHRPARVPSRSEWFVNEDPAKLDQFYERFLGRGGAKMLPDEVKWLAVTHKSFDQGRRGFNDRLAYLGRLTVSLESVGSILTSPERGGPPPADPHGREPFEHPALANVDKLSTRSPLDFASRDKIVQLAASVGLHEVVRWKPKMPENLEGSGYSIVMNGAMFAVIGAISLQHGGEVAAKIVREKLLKRLGA